MRYLFFFMTLAFVACKATQAKKSSAMDNQSKMLFDTAVVWVLNGFEYGGKIEKILPGEPPKQFTLKFSHYNSSESKEKNKIYYITGKGLVNGYGGELYLLGGNKIIVKNFTQTLIASTDDSLNQLESRVFDAISKSTSFILSATQLRLIYPDGALVFEK